jgi:hypothetical protein
VRVGKIGCPVEGEERKKSKGGIGGWRPVFGEGEEKLIF